MAICASKISIARAKAIFTSPGWATKRSPPSRLQMQRGDYICPYYRDRALVLGRGVDSRELALDYFAKRSGQSHGRQMPSHYSYASRGIWSVPTPTGSQLLPGCGIAWGIKLDGKPNVVVATVGDAATRQGDFFEAVCFAKERQLPVLFVVEDNAYGISSPTRKINPRALDVLQPNDWREIRWRGRRCKFTMPRRKRFAHMRAGKGPVFFLGHAWSGSPVTPAPTIRSFIAARKNWRTCEKCDPLEAGTNSLIAEGVLTAEDYEKLDNEIKERIRQEFAEAESAAGSIEQTN